MKIRPVGAELLHVDRQKEDGRTYGHRDFMKLIVAFRNFANASKNFQCTFTRL